MTLPAGFEGAFALAVPLAMAIDHRFGEPPPAAHPVVWIGRGLNACGAPWPGAPAAAAFVRGALAWCAGAALCAAVGWWLQALAGRLATAVAAAADSGAPGGPAGVVTAAAWGASATAATVLATAVHALLLGALLKPLFAWRLLRDEVAAVDAALGSSVDAGRARLARLVSRDTAALSAVDVREAALESLAENLNDSLVAPLFWFAVGGLPAAALYRFANTADAMWGYRGRWEWAGKWAARADDALSWLPARLTAALLALTAMRWPRGLARQAGRTPSPNGGWPMAAAALLLGVRLGKPGVYQLNAAGRAVEAGDVARGLRLGGRAAWLAVAGAALVAGLVASVRNGGALR